MTDKQYTAEDFANAEFARHPDGRIAARVDSDSLGWWARGNERAEPSWRGNYEMARDGWVPVRVAAAHPITLDALQADWESAEVVTEDDPIRERDLLIERHPWESGKAWSVLEADQAWVRGYQGPDVRILHRAPKRPEGAERLGALIEEWSGRALSEEPTPLADWLAERGVTVSKNAQE